MSAAVPVETAASTSSLTRSGWRSAYVAPRTEPHEAPNTSQRSTPTCSRSRSMSATWWPIVMLAQSTPLSLACGVLRPAARWSNSTTR